MTIDYRFYKSKRDLERQYKFWIEITRDLPWAWKPTRSPTNFMNSSNKEKT